MIKKRLLGILVIFLILLSFSFLQAQINSTEEEAKIDEAYECLEDKVVGNCDSLTTEERIFSLLAINKCKTELIEDSSDGKCWPSENCRLKPTAQAILALDNSNSNVDDAKQWLISQTRTPLEMIWYLQIESNEQTTCHIDYTGFSTTIQIAENKKISGDAGQCFSSAQDNYWLEVSPLCYDREFSISCDKAFTTTLLFQRQGSSTIHVFEKTSSSAAGGTLIEKIASLCFKEPSANTCNYEGSLWAAFALDSLGEDVSSYLPYLITLAEDNGRYLPDAFLYLITADTEYRDALLSEQKKIGEYYYWQESLDKYYDTALALFPFKSETLLEKTNSKHWLLETQNDNGCWLDNTRNTAFILASVWPRDFSGGGGGGGDDFLDCEASGNYCVNQNSCGGTIVSDYYCPGAFTVCCTIPIEQQTCSEKGGIICSSSQICNGGNFVSTEDTSYCCINGGSCQIPSTPELSECVEQGGTCRPSCLSDEEEIFYDCEFSGDACCVFEGKEKKSTAWIWILLILIVLVVIGIIFRDKLRDFLLKMKSKSKKSRPGPGPGLRPGGPRPPPRRPPIFPHRPMRRPMPHRERRIIPSLQQPVMPGKSPSKSQKELDDVLRKLKDMSK